MKLIDNNAGMSTLQIKTLYRIAENNLDVICLDPESEVYSVDKEPSLPLG